MCPAIASTWKASRDLSGSASYLQVSVQICFFLGCMSSQTCTWLFQPQLSCCLHSCDPLCNPQRVTFAAVEGCLFPLFLPLCSWLLLLPPVVLPHVLLRWHFACHLHFSCRPRGLEEIREVKQCDFTEGAHDLAYLSFQCFPFFLGPLLVISSYIKCVAIWSKGHVCHVHFVL